MRSTARPATAGPPLLVAVLGWQHQGQNADQKSGLPPERRVGEERIILNGEYLWDLQQATRVTPDTAVANAGREEEGTSQSEPDPST